MSGWPDPLKPGMPLNPERDGWHWIVGWSDKLFVAEWDSDQQDYGWFDGGDDPSGMVENGWTYAGPVLTPAEAGALRAENARLWEALQHAEAAMEGMASDQLTAVETANLWNATMESIRTALEAKP